MGLLRWAGAFCWLFEWEISLMGLWYHRRLDKVEWLEISAYGRYSHLSDRMVKEFQPVFVHVRLEGSLDGR